MNKDRDLSSPSGDVVYGDQASGNITATGGVGGDVVAGDKITNVYTAAAPTVMALHQLPSPPADFIGREAEIEELAAAVEGGGVAIAGLRGQGGVGKTALALRLAARLKDRYPDAQFYLDLRGAGSQPMTVVEALAYVIRAYHPGANLPEGEAELRAAYLSVLHGRRVLLLMDNAKDRRQVEPLVPPAGCLLLVTSRQSFMLPGIFARNLDSLPADDACRLLLAIAPRIGESAAEIARLCGHLPLALRLAACAIGERPNLKPADYVRRLAKVQPRLELIEATLSLSYEMLSEELQRQWRLLAVFPKSFSETGATAVWKAEDETAGEVLGELLAFSLVEWDESADRYRLHDLARVFADSRLNETEREAGGRRHAAHYLKALEAANELFLQGGEGVMRGLAVYDLERANIESGQSWAAAHAEDPEGSELCLAYPRVGASVFALRQHPLERLQWSETMLAVAQRLQLSHPEGQALRNLGRAYMHLGQSRRALEFFERYLELARRIGDRRGEGDALANLGSACVGLGETRRALEFLERYLEITRETGNRRDEGYALRDLGFIHELLGELPRALEFLEQYLEITRETGDRQGEGNALRYLGRASAGPDEVRRVIGFFEQGLTLARQTGDRREEGYALRNLGNAYAALGETRRAVEIQEQRLEIARETGDRRGESYAFRDLGDASAALGEMPRAVEFYQRHVDLTRETGDRRGEAGGLSRQAAALDRLGERARAIQVLEAALSIYEQIEDPEAQQARLTLAKWRTNPPESRE